MNLKNSTILITGGSSGIGLEMVHQFLPHLLQQTNSAIVNVSSGIALMPYSVAPVCSATKAVVRAYT